MWTGLRRRGRTRAQSARIRASLAWANSVTLGPLPGGSPHGCRSPGILRRPVATSSAPAGNLPYSWGICGPSACGRTSRQSAAGSAQTVGDRAERGGNLVADRLRSGRPPIGGPSARGSSFEHAGGGKARPPRRGFVGLIDAGRAPPSIVSGTALPCLLGVLVVDDH